MKKPVIQQPPNDRQGKPRQGGAGNKNILDSRKNEEQDFKGDDVTHNEKDTKAKHLKK